MTLEERGGFVRVLLSSFFSPPTCCRFSVRVMDEPQRRKEGKKKDLKKHRTSSITMAEVSCGRGGGGGKSFRG